MTAALLYGIHDREGRHLLPPDGWCIDTVALSESPAHTDYITLRGDINWIVRLNWGYGSTGTIPLPTDYDRMAAKCAQYVAGSPGVKRVIIGNEPNHEQERPNGVFITPAQYAACFIKCRAAIKRFSPQVEVIPAPCAPYHANPVPWTDYWREMLKIIAANGGCDGIAVHAYTRSSNPADIESTAKMGPPLDGQHSGFLTFMDAFEEVPTELRHLPAYITEFNELLPDGWHNANTGVVQAAYDVVDDWNHGGFKQIRCLALYRWPRFDKWHIEGKHGVIEDFKAAIAKGYRSPVAGAKTVPEQNLMPFIPNQLSPAPTAGAPSLPRDISEGFRRRVPDFTPAEPQPGQRYYRLIKAEYLPPPLGAQRFGPDHHILVDVLDTSGKRRMDTSVNFYWDGKMHIDRIRKEQEPYGVDYPMSSAGHSFGVWVGDFRPNSDDVFGMGLGTIEQPDWGHHVTYYLVFQEAIAESQPAPVPATPPVTVQPVTVPALHHPVQDPQYRRVTQVFGVNGDYYSRYKVDGVPLKGHNGIDFATPNGTAICAVAAGRVVEAADEGSAGYGKYVKLSHAWGESLYAHLSQHLCDVGDIVLAGETIGLSGNTGNSTGPHLHYGMRVQPFNRRDGWGGYTDPAAYLLNTQPAPTQPTDKKKYVEMVIRAAQEFGVDPDLLVSQAQAESSFDPNAVSSAGAKGLLQLMPNTWRETSAEIGGGDDPFDPRQNARVGARYLKKMLALTGGNPYQALIAYGWGPGNWLSEEPRPDLWVQYANKIVFGRDLLKACGL